MPTIVNDYSTGTISVDNSSVTVTGSGVLWNDVIEGDWLWPVGYAPMMIGADVESPYDELTLRKAWPESALVDAEYIIIRISWKRLSTVGLQATYRTLSAQLDATGNFIFVLGAEPDQEMGDDGQFALKTNDGPWKLWVKQAGVWELQGTPVGTTWRGAWDSVTEYLVSDLVARNGNTYIATQASTNKPPESEPTYWDLAAEKGDPGIDGGTASIPLTFSTTTTVADPGNGKVRLNNATQNAATIVVVDLLGSDGLTYTSVLDAALLSSSPSTVIGHARLHKADDKTKFVLLDITSVTSSSGFRQFVGTVIGSSGSTPFANDDALILNLTKAGDRGNTWFSGTSVPSDGTGVNGDFYYRYSTGDIYKKAAGTWGSVLVSVVGPTGARGATWTSGSGAPSDGDGANGDFYFRTSNADVYVKATGTWGSPVVNIKGLTGSQGSPGGFASLPYTVDGLSTMNADPGAGKMRFDTVPQMSSTTIRLSNTTALGAPVGPLLNSIASASSSTIKVGGRLFINSTGARMEFAVTGVSPQINYTNVTIAVLNASSPDPFVDGATIYFDWVPKGDKGDAATIAVGSVATGEADTAVIISNIGTSNAAILNFTIPRGDRGPPFYPVDVVAELADRDDFDAEPAFTDDVRLSVLVESDSSNDDLPTLYFKLSDSSADWSAGFTFIPAGSANSIEYDNSASSIDAVNVQDAIDELDSRVAGIPNPVAMALIFGGA